MCCCDTAIELHEHKAPSAVYSALKFLYCVGILKVQNNLCTFASLILGCVNTFLYVVPKMCEIGMPVHVCALIDVGALFGFNAVGRVDKVLRWQGWGKPLWHKFTLSYG